MTVRLSSITRANPLSYKLAFCSFVGHRGQPEIRLPLAQLDQRGEVAADVSARARQLARSTLVPISCVTTGGISPEKSTFLPAQFSS